MSLLNCTRNTVDGGTSRSPSTGSENTTTGARFGRGGGGGGGATGGLAAASASDGGRVIVRSVASIETTPFLCTATRPVTSSHLPVSRRRPASNSKPEPFGFLPVTHTAKRSSLITQSDDRFRLDEGRSPKRVLPRNCPFTVTSLPSSLPGRVTSSSSVTWALVAPFAFSSGGPRKPHMLM